MGTKVTGVMVLEGTLGLSPSSLRQDSVQTLCLETDPESRESEEGGRKMQTRGSLQTGQHGALRATLRASGELRSILPEVQHHQSSHVTGAP